MAEGRISTIDGLLQDEWRSKQRRQAVAAIELTALSEAANRIASGILAAKRRRK
jgi:hypothetical protein